MVLAITVLFLQTSIEALGDQKGYLLFYIKPMLNRLKSFYKTLL
jgi:hypothetical protein